MSEKPTIYHTKRQKTKITLRVYIEIFGGKFKLQICVIFGKVYKNDATFKKDATNLRKIMVPISFNAV